VVKLTAPELTGELVGLAEFAGLAGIYEQLSRWAASGFAGPTGFPSPVRPLWTSCGGRGPWATRNRAGPRGPVCIACRASSLRRPRQGPGWGCPGGAPCLLLGVTLALGLVG
jgi:hypothetical protein